MENDTPVNEKELTQRVAVLKRFRELLSQQRERLQNCLVVLDNQRNSIETAKTEDLLSYVEMEEQLIADIFSIQKVINPLENMYRATFHGKDSPPDEIFSLKTALEELKQQTIARSSRNRALVFARMDEIRAEIETLRKSSAMMGMRRSVHQNFNTATMVDIKG